MTLGIRGGGGEGPVTHVCLITTLLCTTLKKNIALVFLQFRDAIITPPGEVHTEHVEVGPLVLLRAASKPTNASGLSAEILSAMSSST